MSFKLGAGFESWLDRKIEVLKAEGILRSKFRDLKRSWSVVSEDEHSLPTHTRTQSSRNNNRTRDNASTDIGANMSNLNYFPEYKDDPGTGEQGQIYSDSPDVAGSHDSPRDMSPQSDYYKFVWQDDEDFEAVLGPPGGIDYSDRILREIDSELADLDSYDLGDSKRGHGQIKSQRPRSASKRSADKGHVELLQNQSEAGGGARFVSGRDEDDEDDDEDDSFKDVSDGQLDRWKIEDETSNNNNEQFFDTYDDSPRGGTHEHRRGKADGQSTENVQGGPGGVDLNGNLGGPGPRELRQVARDASDARHYYHTQIAPVSKDRILLPMEEIEMSYSEDELGDEDGDGEAEGPTDEEAIYSPERQAVEAEEMGIDSDDTRPIVTVDQSALSLQWKRKTARIKRAMIIVGIVTAIIAFGLATYFVVHLLTSS